MLIIETTMIIIGSLFLIFSSYYFGSNKCWYRNIKSHRKNIYISETIWCVFTFCYFLIHGTNSNIDQRNSSNSVNIQQGSSNVTLGDKIVVDLYYEVLCPDSRDFLLYQLYPAWQTLSQIFTVNFIPYGKAYVSWTLYRVS